VVNSEKIAITDFPVSPSHLAQMIDLIVDGTISGKIAKDVFEEMLKTCESPGAVVERKGLVQVSDTAALEKVVDEVLSANKSQVESYLSGKTQVFGFFVGATMKATKGKANPKVVNELLRKKLEGRRT